MCSNQLAKSNFGSRRTSQKMKESHSTIGLPKTKKSSRSSFFSPVQSREQRTTSTGSLRALESTAGSGPRIQTKSLRFSQNQTHNLRTMKRNSKNSMLSWNKSMKLSQLSRLELFRSKLSTLSSPFNVGLTTGKMSTAKISTRRPRHFSNSSPMKSSKFV